MQFAAHVVFGNFPRVFSRAVCSVRAFSRAATDVVLFMRTAFIVSGYARAEPTQ